MKNSILIYLAIGLSFSCKKETRTLPCLEPSGGKVVVGDSTFFLQPNVIITNMGYNKTGFFHDSAKGFLYLVNLLDDRLILNPDTSLDVKSYMQHIPIITIPCYSTNPDSLPVGTYNYSNIEPHPVYSFSHTVIAYNYIYEQGGGTFNFDYPEVQKGTLEIRHICKKTYQISLDATLQNGKLYRGAVSTKVIATDSR